ncbi:GGDEF domain-containing protein [Nocardioides sp. SYSU DS0663]|uniref:GGDEF domain-containing protein n=1 Tax=Nocardioides sp. SYSU DS0663 TaxID=3416445 RepID=UPI003F4B291A
MNGRFAGEVDTDEDVVIFALRALLRAPSRVEAARILQAAVTRLGGRLVPAGDAHPDAILADVSLGIGEPLVVVPRSSRSDRRRLQGHVALLLEDAGWSARRSDVLLLEARRASIDPLTRVASRTEIGPALGLARPGDAVCLLDLDDLKSLNDRAGHPAGDRALREFGEALTTGTRDADFVGRYGGDEFLILLPSTPLAVAVQRMEELRQSWGRRENGTAVSIGVAEVDEAGGAEAVVAADRALYRAKRQGKGRVEPAPAEPARSGPEESCGA